MSDYAFNGTTITWPLAVGEMGVADIEKVRDLRFSEDGNEIDITGISDSAHLFAVGLTTEEVEVTVLGSTAVDVDDSGVITITWPDTTTEIITNAHIMAVEKGGSLEGELTSTIRFRQGESVTTE